MLTSHGSILSQLVLEGARWIELHRLPATLLLAALAIAVTYWRSTVRPYLLAGRSAVDRERIATPGAFAGNCAPFPARRLLEQPVPTPFGRWLLPHLVRLDLTQSQLASRLGQPATVLHALTYEGAARGPCTGMAIVDAICTLLELDRSEARAACWGDTALRTTTGTEPGIDTPAVREEI